jgi:ferredoxin
MCEFCHQHGEGKIWYLQMKNYAEELRRQELHGQQREWAGAATRQEWLDHFSQGFTGPAVSGAKPAESGAPAAPRPKLSEAEIVARRQSVHFGQVLPIEDVDKVVEMVDSITRIPCGCRFMTTGKTDQRYCFGVAMTSNGALGEFPDSAASLERLDKAEAKRIIHEFDHEGLMHSIWTGVTPYVIGVCNCDHDCGAYRGYIEKNGPPNFFRAEYVCRVDWDHCTGCKTCMKQCQFGAQFYSSALGKVYIDPTRCFGCGVCRAVCKHEAIALLPREQVPEAANIWLRAPAPA